MPQDGIDLMLSGGSTLEQYATRRSSSALRALVWRMPITAHRVSETGSVVIHVQDIVVGDALAITARTSLQTRYACRGKSMRRPDLGLDIDQSWPPQASRESFRSTADKKLLRCRRGGLCP